MAMVPDRNQFLSSFRNDTNSDGGNILYKRLNFNGSGLRQEENKSNSFETKLLYTGYDCKEELSAIDFENICDILQSCSIEAGVQELCKKRAFSVFDGPRSVSFRENSPFYASQIKEVVSRLSCQEYLVLLLKNCSVLPLDVQRFDVSQASSILYHIRRVPESQTASNLTPKAFKSDDIISVAKRLRTSGNNAYKSMDWEDSKFFYRTALLRIARVPVEDSEHQEELRKDMNETVVIPCYLNMAACELKLKQYSSCIRHCTKVLRRDSSNEKALFRRATALLEVFELEKAQKDINALSQVSASPGVIQRLSFLLEKQKKKEQKRYKNLFHKTDA
mmetsp:Transcript_14345/g.18842  ORF Transcript_14345/g.18842 Transcript_14345/m.18842 type:complete len:334 (+) Transcript_14345:91-1092(+)